MREIQTALRCIGTRRNERVRFEAALHGAKLDLPPTERPSEQRKLDPAKDAYIDAQMKRLIAERRKKPNG